MKKLSNYITEKLKINNSTSPYKHYNYHPKSVYELKSIVNKLIKERGLNADLNDVDVSNVKTMSELFYDSKFNGDISEWDVSNVKNMSWMFANSKFDTDISKWNVSNVKYMTYMFSNSQFNKDISNWNIRKDCETKNMFKQCLMQNNPPAWYEETK